MMASRPRSPDGMRLSDLLESSVAPAITVTGIHSDSRQIQPGDLFFALPGDRHDGRHFIRQAVARGASAVVAEPPVAPEDFPTEVPVIERADLQQQLGPIAARFFGEPSRYLRMTGVTGTNGKTTVSQLTGQLLRACGYPCGVIGTLGASLDGTPQDALNTTPDAIGLQRQLAVWREAGAVATVMEASSHALVQGRVNGVQFDTAVFTNLSRDHLDYHGSMAAYAEAKLRLFLMPGLRSAVINLDDPAARSLIERIAGRSDILTVSVKGDPAATLRLSGAQYTRSGLQAQLATPWGEAPIQCPLIGAFNLSNVAGAVAAAVLSGCDFDQVVARLPQLTAVPGRMQTVPNARGLQVVIDYAHTPDALEKALSALRDHVRGRLLVVFGCGGDRDRGKRAAMGCIACAFADVVYVTSDNPRHEEPASIMDEVAAGCSGNYSLVQDRAEAIHSAIASAREGDCVLIAGKGHENYQVVGADKRPFSDMAEAQAALEIPTS
ncbi:UDP-N-acetylmuramoyl-L-alanyl-D-glutamate--2,6-diaminopimelate ligase [Chromatocurvus halotolerans]|uniref:UDP-N-acetylmuramoyl-L-alanyl-D-glutamate--2,6-diaminopimelate ligase n=1 Tax=Chromatocurvus halotolerans TaxID=1132028 RepID=A0A4R2KPQ6_9GAMM|nr:UDP-N-acetylmuramoyl-L-alanyl-D-glutamate--2,6-diaminopimelate ligase [Chromatocurvus halotolerans]TCO76201.1 UDP-N-acetylmuramoylalanyl-D-glutamate--2,6-diaminopimelate ligase [Chromatocurvus halotolerans]